MKWARVVDNPERATKNASPDDRLSIRFISRDDLKQNFGMWSQYKFPPNFKVTTRGIRDYEMMVGGFLLYYDDIVRNAVVDHAVYLEWDLKEIEHSAKDAKDDKEGRTKKYICSGLSIYLHPKPLRKLSDKYPSVHTASQAPPLHDTVRNHLQDVEATATPAPDFGDFVDPPPPPPPPPPSLDDSMTPGP